MGENGSAAHTLYTHPSHHPACPGRGLRRKVPENVEGFPDTWSPLPAPPPQEVRCQQTHHPEKRATRRPSQEEQARRAGTPPASTGLLVSGLHRHHDLIQRLPLEVGHRGLSAGVPHGEQHQQLLIGGAAQEHPQTGAAVERSGGDRHQPRILKKERKRAHLGVRRQGLGSASGLGTF